MRQPRGLARAVAARMAVAVIIASVWTVTSTPIMPVPAQVADQDPCTAPAGSPVPATTEWAGREALGLWCATQGSDDASGNPVYLDAYAEMAEAWRGEPDRGTRIVGDPLRYPPTRWAGTRGRYLQTVVPAPLGAEVPVELFAPLGPCEPDQPCAPPADGVDRRTGPYPVIMIVHGAGAAKEMHWQTAQALAESGYLVLNVGVFPEGRVAGGPVDVPVGQSPHLFVARSGLDYLLSTPETPTEFGAVNPWSALADRDRVGLIGASFGAIATTYLGQVDERVDAVAAFDSCEYVVDASGAPGPGSFAETQSGGGCRSGVGGLDLSQLRTPRLGISADYWKATDEPRSQLVDPHQKDEYHRALVAQGVDSMQVSLRSGVHAESTYAEPGRGSNTRYGMAVHNYFTLAWFDYQLQGEGRPDVAMEACRRLTATTFDGFADRYEIGVGAFDPALVTSDEELSGNLPWTVGGMPVADRLSFTFASGYRLAEGLVESEDMRIPLAGACDELPALMAASPAPLGGGGVPAGEASQGGTPWLIVLSGGLVLVGVGVGFVVRRARSRRTVGPSV